MVMSQCDVFDLIDPRVLDLVTYDGEKGSEYLLSLWEYLRSNGSMSEACSALCIHRNTLGYRLSRINALFSLDVRSVDDRVAAMHAMGLLLAPAGGSFDAAGIASIIQAMGEGSE
jgi:DNA-binding PucR family transcriptional regulator